MCDEKERIMTGVETTPQLWDCLTALVLDLECFLEDEDLRSDTDLDAKRLAWLAGWQNAFDYILTLADWHREGIWP
jgi:hypothetical protein